MIVYCGRAVNGRPSNVPSTHVQQREVQNGSHGAIALEPRRLRAAAERSRSVIWRLVSWQFPASTAADRASSRSWTRLASITVISVRAATRGDAAETGDGASASVGVSAESCWVGNAQHVLRCAPSRFRFTWYRPCRVRHRGGRAHLRVSQVQELWLPRGSAPDSTQDPVASREMPEDLSRASRRHRDRRALRMVRTSRRSQVAGGARHACKEAACAHEDPETFAKATRQAPFRARASIMTLPSHGIQHDHRSASDAARRRRVSSLRPRCSVVLVKTLLRLVHLRF